MIWIRIFIGTMLFCNACTISADESHSDLMADQFIDMRSGIECIDNAESGSNSRDVVNTCLGMNYSGSAIPSLNPDDPNSIRFHAWILWVSVKNFEALGFNKPSYTDWDQAVSFAQCIESAAKMDDGFFSGDNLVVMEALSSANKTCSEHPLSSYSSTGTVLDRKHPKYSSKILASTLSRLSIISALIKADACPILKPECLPSPQVSPRRTEDVPVPTTSSKSNSSE